MRALRRRIFSAARAESYPSQPVFAVQSGQSQCWLHGRALRDPKHRRAMPHLVCASVHRWQDHIDDFVMYPVRREPKIRDFAISRPLNSHLTKTRINAISQLKRAFRSSSACRHDNSAIEWSIGMCAPHARWGSRGTSAHDEANKITPTQAARSASG